jgi:hypothetical protein
MTAPSLLEQLLVVHSARTGQSFNAVLQGCNSCQRQAWCGVGTSPPHTVLVRCTSAAFQVIGWGLRSACLRSLPPAASLTRKGWCPRSSCNWLYCSQPGISASSGAVQWMQTALLGCTALLRAYLHARFSVLSLCASPSCHGVGSLDMCWRTSTAAK